MKVKEWFELWLSVYVCDRVKERTYIKYKQIATKYVTPRLGDIEISSLKDVDIRRFVFEDVMRKENLSPSSVNVLIAVLKAAFSAAVKSGIIEKDPAQNVKSIPASRKRTEAFTLKEQRKIEEYVLSSANLKLHGIIICLYMGLRIGELLALTWADVDLSRKIVSVSKTLGEKGKIYSAKTKTGNRIIPISNELTPIFRRLKRSGNSEYVIETRSHITNVRGYQDLYRRTLKKIGVRYLKFHSLRHTFATRAVESGMDVKTLSELMGHSNVSITLNCYAHCQLEQKRRAVNRLGKLLCDK